MMIQSILITAMLFGCPKDRTGTSSTADVLAASKEVEGLVIRMSEVEKRISQIESITKARGQSEIMKMESMDQVRMEMANMRGELEQVRFQFSQLQTGTQAQQTDVQFRIDWLEERATNLEESLGFSTPPPAEGAAPTSPQSDTSAANTVEAGLNKDVANTDSPSEQKTTETVESVTDQSLLGLAKDHLQGGREEAAEAILNRILKEYPKSSLEPEVRYRLAEAAFNRQDYIESARRFQAVLQRHPQSPFASWSLLRQGECFEEIGQEENAKVFYQSVIDEYPKSKAAKEAAEKLQD